MKLSPLIRERIRRRAAFTLLEVLVVVAILVILAGVASISVFKYLDEAKEGRAKADMQAIHKAYTSYYIKHSTWPDNLSEVLPYLEQGQSGGQSALMDPWNQQYQATVQTVSAADGTQQQEVVVTCTPPGKVPLRFPNK